MATDVHVGWSKPSQRTETRPPEMDDRHRRALQLAADGLSNFEIGERMGQSKHTVDAWFRRWIVPAMDARNRTEAVANGFRQGWLI